MEGLVKLYLERAENERVLAESLFRIFFNEKKKRGEFTYKTLPQANIEPSKESLKNAGYFFRNINIIINQDES